tara:strand:+ start:1132 stop:1665 length:534 start_codon:yes stop_codon:yes gene_type:complete
MTKLTTTQPSNINQLNIVSFEVNFSRLPNVEYFCQRVNIPAVILGDTFQPMPFMNLPVEGDTLSFEAMNISFILDEDMQNYLEIYSWLTALGFPRDYEQFKTLKPASEVSEYESMFSDMDIMLQTNKSNPNYKVTFNDVFPTSLSSVQFDTSVSALEPIIVDATFNFKGMFNISKLI